MGSCYGQNFRIAIFGESHAAAIGVEIEGVPAGTKIDLDALQAFLERRAPGRDNRGFTWLTGTPFFTQSRIFSACWTSISTIHSDSASPRWISTGEPNIKSKRFIRLVNNNLVLSHDIYL